MVRDRRSVWCRAGWLAVAGLAAGAAAWAAEPVRPGGAIVKFQPFDLRDVRLLEGPCLTAQDACRKYLLELDSDRLLHAFRLNAGLPAPGQPLGGWEAPSCEVRGHFVGHYLSACALMVASTGDEAVRRKADALVAELGRCQDKIGNGYLSAYPESFMDRLEAMEKTTWAPLYVIHKIMAGLLDMHQLTGNRQALDMLVRLAAYYKGRVDKLSDYQMERLLTVEFGGMSEVLHNLYGVTGDPAHLELAHRYDQAAFLGPLALERDNLSHMHGNTQIPKICGAARRYELTGDERYATIVRTFWDRVVHTRTYATGGTTLAEVWPEPNRLAATLGTNNQECCKTHNLLKVTRYLFSWTGTPEYADYYERAFFNGILGTQRADNGQMIYYVPLATGLRKQWGTPYDSFWCCYGTGVETFAKQGDSVYFHDDRSLYVNLFIASNVTWRAKAVRIEQVTRFPEQEGTSLVVHAERPTAFELCLRVPYWATRGVRATVNGQPLAATAAPSSYLRLARTWADGDRVEYTLPMALHAAPMPDDPEMVAVLYGPVVLAGIDADPAALVLGQAAEPTAWVTADAAAPLTFSLKTDRGAVRLVPWNRTVDEAYGVYWVVTPAGSARHQARLAEDEARRQRAARVVDQVVVGNAESEQAHKLAGEKMADGPYGTRHWRHAADGGWLSWELKLPAAGQATLSCTFWGSDVGARRFGVLVDGQTLATQELNNSRPGQFFEVDTPIPEEWTRGKTAVTVRFQAHPGNMAGGVFGCALLGPPR